jgi:predicted RNA-binding protein with PUA domain
MGMSASHPAGNGDDGNPRKDRWPPPEGTAPAPPEEKNLLVKLLMDTYSSQDSLLEDHLLLTNRINNLVHAILSFGPTLGDLLAFQVT